MTLGQWTLRFPPPQGQPRSAQAAPLGAPLVDELLQDSFLRRITTQFFQMLHEERPAVGRELGEQVGASRASLGARARLPSPTPRPAATSTLPNMNAGWRHGSRTRVRVMFAAPAAAPCEQSVH
jgi:hypothetical protein